MSGVVKDSDPDRGSSRDYLHLTALKINFSNKQPKGELRLVLTVDKKDHTVDFGEGGDVRWSGSICCSALSVVSVRVDRRKRFQVLSSTRWKKYASVQVLLSPDVPPVSDLDQRISVIFTASVYREASSHRSSPTPDIPGSSMSSKVKAAQEKIAKKGVIIEKVGKLWSVVEIIESVGDALSDIHPAIGATMLALKLLKEACEKQQSCRDEALELVEQFQPFLSVESRIEELKQREETQRTVNAMLKLIAQASEYILEKTSTSIIGNLFGDEYEAMLKKTKTEFRRAMEAFDRSVLLEVFKAVHSVERNTQFLLLHEKLSECEDAHFKPGKENTCLEGTRVNLRDRIMHWIDDDTGIEPNVFWLRGKAGSGKTTVANTIAQTIDARHRDYHMSCFFCRRDNENLSNPRRLSTTLAYRFAQQHESYRAAVFQLFYTDTRGAGIATTADLDTQLDRLFKEPLVLTIDPLRPHVVIVDAMDECGSSTDQTSLAKCVLALSRLVPWVKIFITSRDEPAIRNAFAPGTCVQCNINYEGGVDDDVRRYLVSQAEQLGFQLSDEEAGKLVRRAEGLFISCSTLFKYVGEAFDPREALEPFLSGEEQNESWGQLYQLYDKVLGSAAHITKDLSFMQAVLAIVSLTASNRPLSAKAITSFLRDHELHKGRREEHVQVVVKKLHAVLYVDASMNSAVRAYHSSFYDFLRQKATEASLGWEKLEVLHGRMYRNCIDTLHTQLHFNICHIEKPILNKDVPDLTKRISANISEELQYSSRFWFTHLLLSDLTELDALPGVSALLSSKELLFWLECLSLQNALAQALLAFWACMEFFQKSSQAIVAAANDARRFVTAFSDAMDSAPHIYLSSLFWLPENSETYRNLGLGELKDFQLIGNKRSNWDVIVRRQSVGQALNAVAYSPDGRYVAGGTEDGDIYIWDSRTGVLEREPLHGHSEAVLSLSYSPDGRFIASGSRDKTIRIWDAKTGEPFLAPLRGHTDAVNCVVYSPSGQHIASCSSDATIRVWNAQTGAQEGKPLRHQDGVVWTVSYSPDGQRIASGGDDCDIHIWSAATHEEIGQPFRGHEGTIRSVGYSPDGRTLVSGSGDSTICIWDSRTGQLIGEPLKGHTDWVRSAMYSPDGRFIVSGSDDSTVRVWDATSGAPIGEPLELDDHSDWVQSVSYSPDGLFIASVSQDGSICTWDAPASSEAQNQLPDYGGAVFSVAFSPDCRHIATGSRHALVCLWDAETGAPVGQPLKGHESPVLSLAWSPDGGFIASGSADFTVRIWDLQAGSAISGEPLRGHTGRVMSVAYSPNGSYIASASEDGTVRLWDPQTGIATDEPLQVLGRARPVTFSYDGSSLLCGFYNNNVLLYDTSTKVPVNVLLEGDAWVFQGSMAFSPDGQYIALGVQDRTVQIWNARTGEPLGISLEGHTSNVGSAAYSPDGHLIASGSIDGIVRLWDAETGQPLQGHSAWVQSVAFSLDGRSLVSGGSDMRVFVYDVPHQHSSTSGALSHWSACCSRMDEQDEWVNDAEILLLWVPGPYRPVLRSRARVMISEHAVLAARVDVDTLSRYSGQAWVNISSSLDI